MTTMTTTHQNSELTLQREHSARQLQRSATYLVNIVAAAIIMVAAVAAASVLAPDFRALIVVAGAIVAASILLSLRIAFQWDRAVVLWLGKFQSLRGPGVFWLVPILNSVARYVDMRIRVTEFYSESTLTRDTVPVNVDAIVFWMVWDARKAVLEVENYYRAIILSAQTALRDIIGTHSLQDMLTQREELGKILQEMLDRKTNPWGITVQSVEIRDVIIPEGLEDAMSKQAQAERERQARIILGTAETEIAAKFVEAAQPYQHNPGAVHLRAMSMPYDALK